MISTADSSSELGASPAGPVRLWRPVLRDGIEMVVAMAAGMVVLGGARSAAGLDVGFAEHPGGAYALMATDMAVAMAAWMGFRGHSWVPTLQMCVAMYLPLILLPLLWVNAVSSMVFMGLAHTLMVPAMFAVLWRQHRHWTPTTRGAEA